MGLISDVGYVYIQEVEFERLEVFMGLVSFAMQNLKYDSAPLVQKLLPLLFARFQQVPLPQSDTADSDKVILRNLGQFVKFF
jgi:hypothetical protein